MWQCACMQNGREKVDLKTPSRISNSKSEFPCNNSMNLKIAAMNMLMYSTKTIKIKITNIYISSCPLSQPMPWCVIVTIQQSICQKGSEIWIHITIRRQKRTRDESEGEMCLRVDDG